MTRKQLIASKKKEILKIENQQRRIMEKMCKVVKSQKTLKAQLRHAGKILAWAMQFRQLEVQKYIIISQPIPKANYKPHPGGMAIVGEAGKEIILSKEDAVKRGCIDLSELPKTTRIIPKFQ